MVNGLDLEKARTALNHIPPDISRDDWVRAGMAAHAAGLSFEDFDAWSSSGESYKQRDARDTWRSFKAGKGIGPGTLIHMARQYGYSDKRDDIREPADQIRLSHQRGSQKASSPGMSADEVWARCKPATADHPYVIGKHAHGAPLDDLRVVPSEESTIRVAGEEMGGALVMPCRRPDGSLATLQFITTGEVAARLKAKGMATKLCLQGHSLEDGWFTVGQLAHGGDVFVCEGLGQAWACWRATGKTAVVSFGWGRVQRVARALRHQDPGARLVLVPDVGKEAEAAKIAQEVDAWVVEMPPGWPINSDVCDLSLQDGTERLAALLSEPKAQPFPWDEVPFTDLDSVDPLPPEQVWGPLVPAGMVTLLGAHGGTGKSLIALMLCVSVALGRPLFGIPTRQGIAVFYSGEDDKQVIRYRLKWVCDEMGVHPSALQGRLRLLDVTDFDPTLYREGQTRRQGAVTSTFERLQSFLVSIGASLVVVDNASDAYDASEIDRAKVRAFMRALARISRATNAGLLLLAHVDKGTSRGERAGSEGYSGSTAWNNSARSRLFMREDGSKSGLIIEHQKANHSGKNQSLRLSWLQGRLPVLDAPIEPVAQGILDQANTKALLNLIAEFTQRGEFIATSPNSRTNAAKMLRREAGYPGKLRDGDVFDLLRRAERSGYLERIIYKTHDRKDRERWGVTKKGMVLADIAPSAPSVPIPQIDAPGAKPKRSAPSAPRSAWGGGGASARISTMEPDAEGNYVD